MAHVAKYKSSALGKLCGHYDRWAKLDHSISRENIDPARTSLNYNLAPERSDQVEFIQDRIASLNLKRAPRKDAVRMCDCVITMPKGLDPSYQDAFFSSCYEFLGDRYGCENVVSSWVHLDETTPHMHFAWVPVTKDGRLSAKDVVDRNDLRSLHSDMQKAVERDLGTKVDLVLDEEQRGEKQLSRLSQPEFIAAKERLECLRREGDRAEQRVADLERSVAEKRVPEGVREAIESARSGDGLEGRVADLRERRDAAKERVAQLEQRRDATRYRVGKLSAAVTKIKTSVENLLKQYKKIRQQIMHGQSVHAIDYCYSPDCVKDQKRVRSRIAREKVFDKPMLKERSYGNLNSQVRRSR